MTERSGKEPRLAPTIRPAVASDRDEIVRLLTISWEELLGGQAPRDEELVRRMNKSLEEIAMLESFQAKFGNPQAGQAAFWVTEIDGKISGCVAAQKTNDFEVELIRMVVDPGFRRAGVGKMLVEQVCQFAKNQGYSHVWLVCASSSGQALYHSCGFRAVEVSRHKSFLVCRFVRTVQPIRFEQVVITGGVHGNELIGPHLVTMWSGNSESLTLCNHPDVARSSMRVYTWLANPKAFAAGVRFVDRDLNRCFELGDTTAQGYETARAKQLLHECPKEAFVGGAVGRSKFQMLVDMHSSASNMGVSLMAIAGSSLNLRLAKYLMRKAHNPRYPMRLILAEDPPRTVNNNIDSVTPLGIAVEVGPLVHGTFGDLELFDATRQCVKDIMDFLHLENSAEGGFEEPGLDYLRHKSATVARTDTIVAYVSWKPVHFPLDVVTGRVRAAIHPLLIGRDFCELQPGDPLFIDLITKETVRYAEKEPAYPIFIGEPAYWRNNVAMVLTRKKDFVVY